MRSQLLALKGWRGFNNPWMAEADDGEEYLYINLRVNPERYTGGCGCGHERGVVTDWVLPPPTPLSRRMVDWKHQVDVEA